MPKGAMRIARRRSVVGQLMIGNSVRGTGIPLSRTNDCAERSFRGGEETESSSVQSRRRQPES
jgi:hypothetical protein